MLSKVPTPPSTEPSTELRAGAIADYAECPAYIFADARTWFDTPYVRGRKDIEPRLRDFADLGGGRVRVTYEWIVNDTLEEDFNCFVHAVNPLSAGGDRIVFQQDHAVPRPTSTWRTGEVIADGPWELSVSGEYGAYDLVIGLFKGERVRLKDAHNNTADEVRYYDSGRWDKWADGLGSSLELIDPDQDNSLPGAWTGSDDSGESEWVTVTYSGTHNQFWTGESELHMYLMGKGEMLIDELQMCTDSVFATTNLARGGGFNLATDYTANWIKTGDTGGNHIDTRWTNEDAYAGGGCLKVVASGRGDSGFNRIECDTTLALSTRTYYLRYRAKWLRGYNVVMTRTHGHGCARSSVIQMPDTLGTPGNRPFSRPSAR